MATPFNSYSFCNGIIASAKLSDFEYFPITVYCILFVKAKEMPVKKLRFYCVQFLRFSAENILRLFKNRSGRARVDQNDIKFVFCNEKLVFEVYYTLTT